jgi:hypothetical protein
MEKITIALSLLLALSAMAVVLSTGITTVGRDGIGNGTTGTGKGSEFHQSNRREPLMKISRRRILYALSSDARMS